MAITTNNVYITLELITIEKGLIMKKQIRIKTTKPKIRIPKLKQQTSWKVEHDSTIMQVNNILAAYQRAGIETLEDVLLLEKKGVDCFDAERYASAGFKSDVKTMIELYKNGNDDGVWVERTELLREAGFSGNKQTMLQLVKVFYLGNDLEYISTYATAGFKGNQKAMIALYKANIDPEKIQLLANHGFQGNYQAMIKVDKLLKVNDISYDIFRHCNPEATETNDKITETNDNEANDNPKSAHENIFEFIEKKGNKLFLKKAKEIELNILLEKARAYEKENTNEEFQKAIILYTKILNKNPDDETVKQVLNSRSELYYKREEHPAYIEDISRLITICEKEINKNDKKQTKQIEYLTRLYYNRAITVHNITEHNESNKSKDYDKADYNKAIDDLGKVLEFVKDSATVYYVLAMTYEKVNNNEKAKINYEKAKGIINATNIIERTFLYSDNKMDNNIDKRLTELTKKQEIAKEEKNDDLTTTAGE